MITVDFKNRMPLYQQLKENIRKLILSGALSPHEQLPSVRALSVSLGINPNTIQRAYAELERDKVVYISQGKGCFVSDDAGLIAESKKTELLYRISALVREAKALSVPSAHLAETIRSIYEENEEENP